MHKIFLLGLIALTCSCSYFQEKTLPYGMTEHEWSELSIQDKTAIRRDFYFVEKGNLHFVNPELQVEGKPEILPTFHRQANNLTNTESTSKTN